MVEKSLFLLAETPPLKIMLTPEEVFYSSYAFTEPSIPSNDTHRDFEYGKRYYICQNSLTKDPPTHRSLIAELGCGNGQRLMYLKEQYGFEESVGIDLGFNAHHKIGTSTFFPANLNNEWPLEEEKVDVLIAMMLIEHLFDPFFCFKEISRVLDKDGRAFINLPLITNIRNRFRLLFGLIPTTSVSYPRWEEEGHWDGFHLHYFTLKSIEDLAKSAGLSIVSIQGVGAMKKLKDLMPTLLCGEISFEVRKIR